MNLCPYQHATKRDNVWVPGEPGLQTVIVVRQVNGRTSHKTRCQNCRATSGALPKDAVWEWFDPFGTPVEHRDNRGASECSVASCVSRDTEWHHFAPWNTFGYDAGDWPILPLCRAHHVEWHQRMDGYRWHRKGVAS